MGQGVVRWGNVGQCGARRSCKVNILRVINWEWSEVVAMWGEAL